jgi:hypothetical protein
MGELLVGSARALVQQTLGKRALAMHVKTEGTFRSTLPTWITVRPSFVNLPIW